MGYPPKTWVVEVSAFFCVQGMVEKWLIQVEEVMISSLKKVTEDAVNAYNQTPRGKWVQEWPGQVTLFCWP